MAIFHSKSGDIYLMLSRLEAKAIHRVLEYQYIPYEDLEAHEALKKVSDFLKECNELDRADSKST